MNLFKQLMKSTKEELLLKLDRGIKESKQDHDTAVLMGSLGVSPKHMNMYFDSMKTIRENENV